MTKKKPEPISDAAAAPRETKLGSTLSLRLPPEMLADLDRLVGELEHSRPGLARVDMIREFIVEGIARERAELLRQAEEAS